MENLEFMDITLADNSIIHGVVLPNSRVDYDDDNDVISYQEYDVYCNHILYRYKLTLDWDEVIDTEVTVLADNVIIPKYDKLNI